MRFLRAKFRRRAYLVVNINFMLKGREGKKKKLSAKKEKSCSRSMSSQSGSRKYHKYHVMRKPALCRPVLYTQNLKVVQRTQQILGNKPKSERRKPDSHQLTSSWDSGFLTFLKLIWICCVSSLVFREKSTALSSMTFITGL